MTEERDEALTTQEGYAAEVSHERMSRKAAYEADVLHQRLLAEKARRREGIAKVLLAGMLASNNKLSSYHLAMRAVAHADVLIAVLDEEPFPTNPARLDGEWPEEDDE